MTIFSPLQSRGEPKTPACRSVEELKGIVAGLTAIVKQQPDALKATTAQITQLTEALIAHVGPPAASPATSTSNTSLQMPTLQLPQFRYDHSSHDDVNEFLETFDVQTAHLPAETKLALLQAVVYWRMAKFSLVNGEIKIHRRNHSQAEAWQLETSLKNIIRGTARSSAPSFWRQNFLL